jgi:hypothetical protein
MPFGTDRMILGGPRPTPPVTGLAQAMDRTGMAPWRGPTPDGGQHLGGGVNAQPMSTPPSPPLFGGAPMGPSSPMGGLMPNAPPTSVPLGSATTTPMNATPMSMGSMGPVGGGAFGGMTPSQLGSPTPPKMGGAPGAQTGGMGNTLAKAF